MKRAPAFIITESRRIPGARLSLAGEWGNLPFVSREAAEAEARRIGGPDAGISVEVSK